MSNPALKKNHWTFRVSECSVSRGARGGDAYVPLRGGAENGEFAYIGRVDEEVAVGNLNEGELLLEVENLSISGLPLYDVQTVIRNCRGPVKLKTVRQGKDRGTRGGRAHNSEQTSLPFFKINIAQFSETIT